MLTLGKHAQKKFTYQKCRKDESQILTKMSVDEEQEDYRRAKYRSLQAGNESLREGGGGGDDVPRSTLASWNSRQILEEQKKVSYILSLAKRRRVSISILFYLVSGQWRKGEQDTGEQFWLCI